MIRGAKAEQAGVPKSEGVRISPDDVSRLCQSCVLSDSSYPEDSKDPGSVTLMFPAIQRLRMDPSCTAVAKVNASFFGFPSLSLAAV